MENLNLDGRSRAVVTRMEHVHVQVADAARSVEFYRKVFGFEVRWDSGEADGRCVHVGTDRFYVALTEDPGVAPSGEGEGGGARIYHVGLTTGDLPAFARRLEAAGIEAEVYHRKEGDAIYVYDPDGHEIEVVGYAAGYAYA